MFPSNNSFNTIHFKAIPWQESIYHKHTTISHFSAKVTIRNNFIELDIIGLNPACLLYALKQHHLLNIGTMAAILTKLSTGNIITGH